MFSTVRHEKKFTLDRLTLRRVLVSYLRLAKLAWYSGGCSYGSDINIGWFLVILSSDYVFFSLLLAEG